MGTSRSRQELTAAQTRVVAVTGLRKLRSCIHFNGRAKSIPDKLVVGMKQKVAENNSKDSGMSNQNGVAIIREGKSCEWAMLWGRV